MARVLVIGLDALSPRLVFDVFRDRLPRLAGLGARGVSGPMQSTVPPVTIPAWTAMVTGLDPGALGIYGFHDRADRSYGRRRLASSLHVGAAPVWTLLSRAGFRCRVLGVPQTYPPKPVRGVLVAGPPLPLACADLTYPPEARPTVDAEAGGYVPDITDFRHRARDEIRADILEMTARRFRLANTWAGRDDWDFMMLVEMGPDRMQHSFWDEALLTPEAVAARADNPLRDYYVTLDQHLGALLDCLRPDDTVLVVSDHGAQARVGGFAINDWLAQEGYLALRERAATPTALEPDRVDWRRTRAWADGGYAARLYVNVAGREPDGVVPGDAVPALVAEIRAKLGALQTPGGRPVATEAFEPRAVYAAANGVPPELIAYLDGLGLRAVGSVGHESLFVRDNDTGPDAANHAAHGVFILADGSGPRPAPDAISIYDVAPTILGRFGLAPQAGMRGRVL
ncbi:MAG: alkaline phosphatase family protein [Deltaproteobacteria bacterium]|nr:alkaline phosphatase family protein [Deltaproteobacteria bacterium]